MKKIIIQSVSKGIETLGPKINPLLLNISRERNRLLVFCFHGLYASAAERELGHVDPQNNFTVEEFEQFIEYFLENNYRFLKPDDLAEDLPKDRPYAMLTFDDGYFNNSLAVDVLSAYQVPATFFITTRNVVEQKSYWWDIIYKYRMRQGVDQGSIRSEQGSLKKYKPDYIDDYIEKHFGRESTKPWSDIDRPFRIEELKSFAASPWVTIGNHTLNHAILTNCTQKEVLQELVAANATLTEIIGHTPDTIAFPNGNFSDMVLSQTRAAGFRFAFTTTARKNPLPTEATGFQCIDRFMAQPGDVQNRGEFWRIGYSPDSWYSAMKNRLKVFTATSMY